MDARDPSICLAATTDVYNRVGVAIVIALCAGRQSRGLSLRRADRNHGTGDATGTIRRS
jgi:hypothetical protein